MSTTLIGVVKNCNNNIGGIKKVYLIYKNDITSITESTVDGGTQITAMTLNSVKFKNYVFPKNTANYTVTVKQDNFGVTEFNQVLNFKIPVRSQKTHKEMLAILHEVQDLCALVQDGNSEWWLLGYPYGLNLQTQDGGSGTTPNNGTTYNLSLVGISDDYEINVDEDIIDGLI